MSHSYDIICTLGPSSLNEDVVGKLDRLGVSLFRINLSHTPLDKVEEVIDKIAGWTDKAICLDSEGAQMRNESMVSEAVALEPGETVKIHFDSVVGDSGRLSFSPKGIAREFQVGDKIRIDFDHLCLSVTSVEADHCTAVVETGGIVGSNKAADSSRLLPLPFATDKDRGAFEIGRRKGVKTYALSFASSAADVKGVRDIVGPDTTIISKVESRIALMNLVEIIKESDKILIDRGDLSRSISVEKIPFLQRRIIATAKAHRTPVYVATNLLETMIARRSPTRAEVNDVVSTLQMGADGLVLAAETAIGKFPVEAV